MGGDVKRITPLLETDEDDLTYELALIVDNVLRNEVVGFDCAFMRDEPKKQPKAKTRPKPKSQPQPTSTPLFPAASKATPMPAEGCQMIPGGNKRELLQIMPGVFFQQGTGRVFTFTAVQPKEIA